MALLAILMTAGVQHFLTPGPNRAACDIGAQAVQCVVEYPQVPMLDAFRVTMTPTARISLCRGIVCTNAATESAPTLPYGRSLSAGPFRCTSAPAGVKCVVVATGHGFRLGARGVNRV